MNELREGEIRPVLMMAAVVMAVTIIPYAAALFLGAPEQVFGGFIWGVDEGNAYMAWIRQASEGRLLLANQYTTEPQNPHFFNLFFSFCGAISAAADMPPIIVFRALRVIGGIFMLGSFYWLVSLLTADRWIRRSALALCALGSGLGWLVVYAHEAGINPGLQPIDVGVWWQVQPEAVTFLSALLNPLFIISMGLMCLVMGYALIALETRSRPSAVLSGVLLLILGNVHTYDIFPTHAALGLWIIFGLSTRRYSLKNAATTYAIIFLVALPAPLWSYWAANQDPAYMAKALTETKSLGLVNYLVGYGLLGVLALVGLGAALRRPAGADDPVAGSNQHRLLLFPAVWIVAHCIALTLPVSFQRKMIEGLHMPISMLAGVGVIFLGRLLTRRLAQAGNQKLVRRQMAMVVIAAVALTVPSNMVFVAQCMENVRTNNEMLLEVLVPPIYMSGDYAGAVRWLADESREGEVVFSSSLIGSHIPAHAPCTVYLGHWAETLQFGTKLGDVMRFYAPGSGVDRAAAVRELGLDYVVYGPYERMLGAALPPNDPRQLDLQADTGGELKPAFTAGEVTVFRAVKADG